MMRVIVTGDRHWDCKAVAERVLGSLRERHGTAGLVIIHGAAQGVDAAFAAACDRLGIGHEPHRADWGAHGKRAGPLRNQEMIDVGADFAIAVHRDLDGSRGTLDCVRRCLAAAIPVYLIDGVNPDSRIDRLPVNRPCPVCDGPTRRATSSHLACNRCGVEFHRDARR